MTLAVIVQARHSSTRLPGKILNPLGNKTALIRVLDRCAQIPHVDKVICAVPDAASDDMIAAEAVHHGYLVSRGSETDVLQRYARAARDHDVDHVMRVTSDCPFIDPQICGQVIDLLGDTHSDYATNNMPATFPHGLDCEIFPSILLHEADRKASHAHEREHVTPWLRTHAHLRKANLRGPGQGLERLRWTLDYAEDLLFFETVFEVLGEAAATVSATDLAALCLRRPDLVAINEMRIDESRLTDRQQAEIATAPHPLNKAA
jgi:spore coat polysaccharide biosynthesis protein SpsF